MENFGPPPPKEQEEFSSKKSVTDTISDWWYENFSRPQETLEEDDDEQEKSSKGKKGKLRAFLGRLTSRSVEEESLEPKADQGEAGQVIESFEPGALGSWMNVQIDTEDGLVENDQQETGYYGPDLPPLTASPEDDYSRHGEGFAEVNNNEEVSGGYTETEDIRSIDLSGSSSIPEEQLFDPNAEAVEEFTANEVIGPDYDGEVSWAKPKEPQVEQGKRWYSNPRKEPEPIGALIDRQIERSKNHSRLEKQRKKTEEIANKLNESIKKQHSDTIDKIEEVSSRREQNVVEVPKKTNSSEAKSYSGVTSNSKEVFTQAETMSHRAEERAQKPIENRRLEARKQLDRIFSPELSHEPSEQAKLANKYPGALLESAQRQGAAREQQPNWQEQNDLAEKLYERSHEVKGDQGGYYHQNSKQSQHGLSDDQAIALNQGRLIKGFQDMPLPAQKSSPSHQLTNDDRNRQAIRIGFLSALGIIGLLIIFSVL